MIGKLECVVLDCPEPRELAEFYAKLIGGEVVSDEDGGWVTLKGGDTTLAFQRALDHQPPAWPDPARPQQFHLDLRVDDIERGERDVLAVGASVLDGSEKHGRFRVYADPAGHPFCLVY